MSTGAANDLERVTKLARAMVSYYGMSDKLPNVNYFDPQDEYGFSKPYSEKTGELIDAEVLRIIDEQFERAKNILKENEEGHHKIASLLLEKEVIYTEDVENILGKRPWESRTDELAREDAEQKEKENQKEEEEKRPTPPPLNPNRSAV